MPLVVANHNHHRSNGEIVDLVVLILNHIEETSLNHVQHDILVKVGIDVPRRPLFPQAREIGRMTETEINLVALSPTICHQGVLYATQHPLPYRQNLPTLSSPSNQPAPLRSAPPDSDPQPLYVTRFRLHLEIYMK